MLAIAQMKVFGICFPSLIATSAIMTVMMTGISLEKTGALISAWQINAILIAELWRLISL